MGKQRKRISIHEYNLKQWDSTKLSICLPNQSRFPDQLRSEGKLGAAVGSQAEFRSVQIDADKYDQMPYSAVGKLSFHSVNHQTCQPLQFGAYGTAWIIGPRTIMTVAHNIVEVNCGSLSSSMVFVPGFGATNEVEPERIYSIVARTYMPEYPSVPSAGNDVAICTLDRDITDVSEPIPPILNPSFDFERCLALGYPGNHQPDGNKMWQCDGEFLGDISSQSDRMIMASDFGGGSSGGPWLVETDQGWRALGLQVGPVPNLAGHYQGSAYFGSKVQQLVNAISPFA